MNGIDIHDWHGDYCDWNWNINSEELYSNEGYWDDVAYTNLMKELMEE